VLGKLPLAAILGALVVLVALPRPAAADEPVRLHVAWAAVPSHIVPLLREKPGLLRHDGSSYRLDPVLFRGSAAEVAALANGELEIAALSFGTFGLAIQNAHMEDLRAIGDGNQGGVTGHFSTDYVVLADSPIAAVEDLKGKVVASNGIGGANYMAIRKMLLDHGLEENRDYRAFETRFPDMLAVLHEKKADLVTLVQPFAHLARAEGSVRTLFTMRDAMGETQTTLLAARAPFIAAHRAALVDFFEDMQDGLRWFMAERNRDEALQIIARFTKRPASQYDDWLYTAEDDYHDPDVRPNLRALQSNLDLQRELGLLRIQIDVGRYADLSLVDEAAKRPR
jgi:sulfonate transport system substrate-binding protein